LTNPLVDAQNRKLQTDLDFCLGSAQVDGAINSVFSVVDADALWTTMKRSKCTREDSRVAVSRFIMGQLFIIFGQKLLSTDQQRLS